LKNGNGRKSLVLEKFFSDIVEYLGFNGLRGATMTFTAESGSIVNGAFTINGKEALLDVDPTASRSGQTVPSTVNDPLNGTTNLGTIEEAGVALTTALQSIELEIGNNLRVKPQIGSKSPIDVGYGFVDVTGTVTAYFQDMALYRKFINHTSSSLRFRFTDGDGSTGNVMEFTIPKLFFSDGNPTAEGGNDDVLLPLEFTAVRDATTSAVLVIDIVEAGL